jgi:hypothetical protein
LEIPQGAAVAVRSWRPVKDLCDQLIAEMAGLAPDITAAIRAEEPDYEAVPVGEHEAHVREQQVRLLQAVAERREPNSEDLQRAEALGRRRATQNLPVHVVIGAYHVGNRELWGRMQVRAGPSAAHLADVAAMMWRSVQLVTARLAEAHAEVSAALHADQITLRHRLVALLQPGHVEAEAVPIADRLGFDSQGSFVALAMRAVDLDDDGSARLQNALASVSGTAISAQTEDRIMVLAQVRRVAELLTAVAHATAAPVAVGLERAALDGAAESLRDAERLLATLDRSAGIQRFQDGWLPAVLLADATGLRALVAPQLDVVRANPHLADAVVAFAENDLSATAAARAMGLHPNTTMYRLARWRELTGWDAKTYHGLSLSLLACWMGREITRN